MIDNRRKTMRSEKSRELTLVLQESRGDLRRGKACCQVQVQTAVDIVFPREGGGPFRSLP